MNPYLDPPAEFFDRAAVPPQIQELLDEWPEIDPGTARLIRAAYVARTAATATGVGDAERAGGTGAGDAIKRIVALLTTGPNLAPMVALAELTPLAGLTSL